MLFAMNLEKTATAAAVLIIHFHYENKGTVNRRNVDSKVKLYITVVFAQNMKL